MTSDDKNSSSVSPVSTGIKQRAVDVFMNDPNIAAALARVGVFVVDHDPQSPKVSAGLCPPTPAGCNDDPSRWLSFVHPDDQDAVRTHWQDVLDGRLDVFDLTYRFRNDEQSDEYLWISSRGTVVYRDEQGLPSLYIGADRDFTEQYHLQSLLEQEREKLSRLVVTDAFLEIPNRRFLETSQEQFFPIDGQHEMAVMVFDIDNFKKLNSDLSHKGGDEVLRDVVAVVRRCLRPKDVLARFGGDEFVVVMADATLAEAERTASMMLQQVWEMTIPIPDRRISVSVGVTHGRPVSGFGFWEFFEEADDLLLEAKRQGKARILSRQLEYQEDLAG